MTLYESFVNRWSNCTKCSLQYTRSRVVLARGKVPCEVLFVGEAPGMSEDTHNKPFWGPAGELLDKIITAAGVTRRTAFANMVCCIPLDESGQKVTQPEEAEISSCGDRLREFVAIAKPRVIVAVGDVAATWLPRMLPTWGTGFVDIVHPAAILRQGQAQRGFSFDRCVNTLRDMLREVFGE